jgi:transposase
MPNTTLRNDQWEKIYLFLKDHPRAYAGDEADCRLFVEGVLWIARSGAQWRLLPEAYGYWNTVYKRFARWCEHDIWNEMHQHFAGDPDMENILLDSTVVRAHPCAAGALKKTGARRRRPLVEAEAGSAPKSMPL